MTQPPPAPSSLENGIAVIKTYLKTLPERPGVYRMMGQQDQILYVGKAKSLKKRVANYTQPDRLPGRIQRMVALTHRMEFIETHTEAEALLLEANLIKKLRPTYNVLLKDDKMYPYIMLSTTHEFPGAYKYRGVKPADQTSYGPFLSGSAVTETITLLHKVFQIRNCSDHYFATRTRPCLQYHIKRCTAPCVGKVSREDYATQIQSARALMEGRTRQIQDDFAGRMQAASDAQDYETAVLWRDKIRMLSTLLAKQSINVPFLFDADVIATTQDSGVTAIQVFFFRAGQNYGNLSYFPRQTDDDAVASILSAFMGQFYADKIPPSEILLSTEPDELEFLQSALSEKAGRKVDLVVPQRGDRRQIVDFALDNAAQALARHLASRAKQADLMAGVQKLFDLPKLPDRIEVYDNSHLGGTGQVGAMIVAGPEGFRKNAYRKFNIRQAQASDDYGMMREVMQRRFKKSNSEHNEAALPDLLLIDGGPGQLSAVRETLTDMGIWDALPVVAISKGPDRNAGREWLHRDGHPPIQLPINDPVLHYLQRLRDEAHRFAIGSQRTRREPGLKQSVLDAIPGIGAKRKKALLHHFGSAKDVADAALADLMKVDGISKTYAMKIYSYFHNHET